MSEEMYNCDDMSCPKCKRIYAFSFKAKTYAEAVKIVRAQCYELCSFCTGENTATNVAAAKVASQAFHLFRDHEYRSPMILSKHGDRWLPITWIEKSSTKWERTLRAINNGLIDSQALSGAPIPHYHQCICPQCQLTNLIKEEEKNIYEYALKRSGLEK